MDDPPGLLFPPPGCPPPDLDPYEDTDDLPPGMDLEKKNCSSLAQTDGPHFSFKKKQHAKLQKSMNAKAARTGNDYDADFDPPGLTQEEDEEEDGAGPKKNCSSLAQTDGPHFSFKKKQHAKLQKSINAKAARTGNDHDAYLASAHRAKKSSTSLSPEQVQAPQADQRTIEIERFVADRKAKNAEKRKIERFIADMIPEADAIIKMLTQCLKAEKENCLRVEAGKEALIRPIPVYEYKPVQPDWIVHGSKADIIWKQIVEKAIPTGPII